MDIENKINSYCMRFENLDAGDVFVIVNTGNKIYMKILVPEMYFPATMTNNMHFKYLAADLETGGVIEIESDTLVLRISGKFTVTID